MIIANFLKCKKCGGKSFYKVEVLAFKETKKGYQEMPNGEKYICLNCGEIQEIKNDQIGESF